MLCTRLCLLAIQASKFCACWVRFFDDGYADGFAHGRIHGLIEGRALGREKGFEMWEELAFYEGFARLWGAALSARGDEDRRVVSSVRGNGAFSDIQATFVPFSRSVGHIKHLLDFIASFPRVNPSTANIPLGDTHEVDIPKLFRQIRSRYKALCASLGVRASLRAAEEDALNGPSLDGNPEVADGHIQPIRTRVWKVEGDRTKSQDEGLSF